MFSWLFGKSKAHKSIISLNLKRISFLMEYLQQCSLKDKNEVVQILNKGLMLGIPDDVVDSDDRLWPDPSNNNLAISFSFLSSSVRNQVNQLIINGFGDIANTLVIGTANEHKDGKLMWRVSAESEARETPFLSGEIQNDIWEMPGWRISGVSGYKYLEKE